MSRASALSVRRRERQKPCMCVVWRRRRTRTKGPLCKCGVCVSAVMFSWRIGGVCRAKCNLTCKEEGLLINMYVCVRERKKKRDDQKHLPFFDGFLDRPERVCVCVFECVCYEERI